MSTCEHGEAVIFVIAVRQSDIDAARERGEETVRTAVLHKIMPPCCQEGE